jgi:hypothetical protein
MQAGSARLPNELDAPNSIFNLKQQLINFSVTEPQSTTAHSHTSRSLSLSLFLYKIKHTTNEKDIKNHIHPTANYTHTNTHALACNNDKSSRNQVYLFVFATFFGQIFSFVMTGAGFQLQPPFITPKAPISFEQ